MRLLLARLVTVRFAHRCVDELVDFDELTRRNQREAPLEIPPSLEEETTQFRAEVVRRAGVVGVVGCLPAIDECFALELVIGSLVTLQTVNTRSVGVFRALVSLAARQGS